MPGAQAKHQAHPKNQLPLIKHPQSRGINHVNEFGNRLGLDQSPSKLFFISRTRSEDICLKLSWSIGVSVAPGHRQMTQILS